MRCQPDRRWFQLGMAIAAHSISTADFDPPLHVFGADHTLRLGLPPADRSFFLPPLSKGLSFCKRRECKRANPQDAIVLIFSRAPSGPYTGYSSNGSAPRPTQYRFFVETGGFLDRPSQERASAPWFLHSHPWRPRFAGCPTPGPRLAGQACLLLFDPPEFHCFDLV